MEDIIDNALKPIIFKTSLGFVYFDYIEIIMCSADGNCSNVFTIKNDTPLKILHKISFIERKYCDEKFIRCHKSHIINLSHIEKLITKDHTVQLNRSYIVPLSDICWRKIKGMSEMNIHEY